MPDSLQVQQLLDELLDAQSTPEEVCRSCPELIPLIRKRWRQMCHAQGELDELFPPLSDPHADSVAPVHTGTLPRIVGYEVEAILGRGGMGVVFRARQVRLNRIVALKMALAGAYAGLHERERFQREAEAVAGLQHPNIVQIYDVGDSDGRPYYTMEFVQGGTLAQKLAGIPRPPREAATLLTTLAGAVSAAHASGIIHRDLKPSNILLTADGIPKISDFGLARRLAGEPDLTLTGTTIGTPSYMAPEQAGGKLSALEPGVDVYALGVILYELLTGRPPFRAETAEETVQQVISKDPVPPSQLNDKIPRDLEIICLKCLRKDTRLRYGSAADLADDLNRFLHGEAIKARPEGRLERWARRARRRPALSGSLVFGTLFLFVLVGSGLLLLSERASTKRRIQAEETAAERTATENLQEMVDMMKRSCWPEARAALERAKVWVRNRDTSLSNRLAQGDQDLALAARLETIRLTGFARVDSVIDFTQSDKDYEEAFREAGIGGMSDSPQAVAERIKASNIKNALMAAIDNWSICTTDAMRKGWLKSVVRQSDDDTTGWRARTSDPEIWTDESALFKLIETASVPEQSVQLLLTVELQANMGDKTRIAYLKRVHAAYPRDFWVNFRLGNVLANVRNHAEAIGFYQAAVAIRPDVAILHNNLGVELANANRVDEAIVQYRLAISLEPANGLIHHNLILILWNSGRRRDAMSSLPEAIRVNPQSAQLRVLFGLYLESQNRYTEALAEFQRAVESDPNYSDALDFLRGRLERLGRVEDARIAWEQVLKKSPSKHDVWYGYAEFCLFLGREKDYRLARSELLAKFGSTSDMFVAERTSRACLLRPIMGDELVKALALVKRTAAAPRAKFSSVFHAFLFVNGLAEYRQNQFDQAIATMSGDASRALSPAPRLVIAMAQHRKGLTVEAQKTLAEAISSYDWRKDQIHDQDGWIRHILRREAEELIFPNRQAVLDGKQRIQDNNERLALLGVYQFTNQFDACARLYTDAFAADPSLGQDMKQMHRYNAARMAAMAGCGLGLGHAGKNLEEAERIHWREQARQWLKAELAQYQNALEKNIAQPRSTVRNSLKKWQETPDLAGLREQAELEKMAQEERKECLAIWSKVSDLLKRCEAAK